MTDYKIHWDNGDGSTMAEIIATTSAAVTIPVPVTSTKTYVFSVLAVNAYGDGALSNTFSILAAITPAQMADIIVATVTDTKISLTWTPPLPRGSPITDFEVLILNKQSNLFEHIVGLCDALLLELPLAQWT